MAFKKISKKRKFFEIFIFLISLLLIFLYSSFFRKVEILYFRNDKCPIVLTTDKMIEEARKKFGDRVEIKIFNVKYLPEDPEDPPEIKELREKYRVIGLPEIIINGKKFAKKYKSENLFSEICKYFLVRPIACL